MMRCFGFLILFTSLGAGCAGSPVARKPAAVDSGAQLSADERAACDESECTNLVAPCTMLERAPKNVAPESPLPRPLSMMEERYLNEMDLLHDAGYCQLQARPLPAETYNHNTCLYVFVKRGKCY
jgi:hypothetical protein